MIFSLFYIENGIFGVLIRIASMGDSNYNILYTVVLKIINNKNIMPPDLVL